MINTVEYEIIYLCDFSAMQFNDFLSKDNIFIDPNAQTKTAVLLKISQLLSKNQPLLDTETLFDAYWKRESLGSTTIGHGIIIPHIRTELTSKAMGCFLKLHHPVDFGAEDKQPIDLVLALLVPQDQTDQHLKMLSLITQQFSDPSFRIACRLAKNRDEIYQLFIQESIRVEEPA